MKKISRRSFVKAAGSAAVLSMLAACGAQGLTILDNPAREPEIVDLQNFLRCLGARVEGRCFRQEA